MTPEINVAPILFKNRHYNIEYFIRKGSKGTLLFIHGLGGAKENFWEAMKSSALKDHTIIGFDNPGTGNSSYYNDQILGIDDLVEITASFIDHLRLNRFILCGASMGGLITLLYLQRNGFSKVKSYINIEGNLMPEDCMFSSKVVQYSARDFEERIFAQTIIEMKKKDNAGYHIIANNLELNTNITSYYHYSFPTVSYSSTGDLLKQYIEMNLPRLFIYGDKNKGLTYLPVLKSHGLELAMIPDSDHFVFYDNPKEMYHAISSFVERL